MTDDASFERLMDLSGLASSGGITGAAPQGALTAGLARRGKGPPPVGKWAKFAERYPDVPPPVNAIDKKSGKPYLAKGTTPENEQFMKDRLAIQHDMEANGYEPYFDPAQRFDVDPSKHPMPHSTVTQNLGKKEATRAQYDAVTLDPAVLDRFEKAYANGTKLDSANWYAMGQLEAKFIEKYGEEQGRRLFRERFAGSMAATTGGADPQNNLLMAMYGNYLQKHGLPYPKNAYDMPNPIGGRFASGNLAQHEKFAPEGMVMDGAKNPKRYDFQSNFLGHRDRATIDEQMMGIIDPEGAYGKAPPADMYGHFEKPAHVLAERYGVDPIEMQEVAWAGAKNLKDPSFMSGPMIGTVNDMIERTHRLTGMPRDEIVERGFLGSEIPLYQRNDIMAAMLAHPLPEEEEQ